jgi:hypothetical protein
MIKLSILPVRQKLLIGMTILMGLFLIVSIFFDLLGHETLNKFVLYYGICVPLLLLMFDTLIDLNNKNIFFIWLIIATMNFVISLATYDSDMFAMRRSSELKKSTGLSHLIADHSTSSLKALLIFLFAYWLFNKSLRKKGLFIINTFWQYKWYNDVAQRQITGKDVAINFILFITIIAAGIFG